MKYYIGVDGGGTSTVFLLGNQDGQILGTNKQSTIHYLQCGYDGVTKVLDQGITSLLNDCNLTADNIAHVFIACAGYGDIPKDTDQLDSVISDYMGNIPFHVGNDTDNALAGSLAGGCGINIISGTGSIGLGKDKHGNVYRSGGWNHLFGGDEGSAFWLASNMLRIFTRQSDGRDKKTLLYSYLKEVMSWEHDADMMSQCIVEWDYDRTKIASLAVHIFELAKLGDPVAINLYKQAAIELGDIAISIHQALDFDEHTPTSYSGSVFKSQEFILEPLDAYLKQHGMYLVPPKFGPDIGSLILAMQYDNQVLTHTVLQNLTKVE